MKVNYVNSLPALDIHVSSRESFLRSALHEILPFWSLPHHTDDSSRVKSPLTRTDSPFLFPLFPPSQSPLRPRLTSFYGTNSVTPSVEEPPSPTVDYVEIFKLQLLTSTFRDSDGSPSMVCSFSYTFMSATCSLRKRRWRWSDLQVQISNLLNGFCTEKCLLFFYSF